MSRGIISEHELDLLGFGFVGLVLPSPKVPSPPFKGASAFASGRVWNVIGRSSFFYFRNLAMRRKITRVCLREAHVKETQGGIHPVSHFSM
jgi:hypothetical protein